MKSSLENRVPLLDHQMVEFAINLSPQLKWKKGEKKYLLKQLLYQYIPASYFQRPKWGFSIPLCKWLKGELGFMLEEYLNQKVVEDLGIVRFEEVNTLIKGFRGGKDYLYNRLWVLILLHKWMREKSHLLQVSKPAS